MNSRTKRLIIIVALILIVLTPQMLSAEDGLSLESLSARIDSLVEGQNDSNDRISALETRLAPTPNATGTARAVATVLASVDETATAEAKPKATATARARYRATQVAQANARATRQARANATATAEARTAGCSFSDSTIPDPPYSYLDCETWKAAFILAEIEFGRVSRSQLREVADSVYPMVATGARYCGVSASRLADYVAVTAQQLMKQGKPSASPDNAITYVLMYVSSSVFEETVEIAGCEQTLGTFVILSE